MTTEFIKILELSVFFGQAIREGADAVIAVGGDGTLHEV